MKNKNQLLKCVKKNDFMNFKKSLMIKKTIFLFLLICNNFILKAQGNLQFNEVKRVNNTSLVPYGGVPTNFTTITVPLGKVWKIESSCVNAEPNSVSTVTSTYLSIGGQTCFGQTSAQIYLPPANIWLPEGSYPVKVTNLSGSAYTLTVTISAIEFNIVP